MNDPFEPLTLAILLVAIGHLAAVGYSWHRGWSPTVPLWILRADLAAVAAYWAYRAAVLFSIGNLPYAGNNLMWAAGLGLAVGVTFLKLPAWLVWLAYGGATLLALAVAAFALTFRMDRLW